MAVAPSLASVGLFNVLLVLISALLQLSGFIVPFSNSINHLFPQLLESNIVDGWLKGKNYAAKDVKRAFFIVRSMERDCEKRAVRLINEFKLKIDTKMYSKRAHVYIYSHFMMEKSRKFYSFKQDPYYSKCVLRIMPSNMAVLSHVSIPTKVYSVLESLMK